MRGDLSLPEAPRLVALPEEPAPTPQARETAKDGGPLDPLSTCRWCGGMHPTACPFIKVAEWHENGQLSRIVLEERAEQKTAILYPFEEDDGQLDALRRALGAISQASDLDAAQKIAATLLQLLDQQQEAEAKT